MKKTVLAVAKYRIEDWGRLLELSDDKSSLEETWYEWNDNIHRFEDQMRNQNILFKEVFVDLDELAAYCERTGVKINAESRSSFVSEKSRRES